MKKIINSFLVVALLFIFFSSTTFFNRVIADDRLYNHNDLNQVFNDVETSVYMPYSEYVSDLNVNLNGNKIIMIETATDLYNLSQFLKYEVGMNSTDLSLKQSLANKHFVLGNDIDYSTMKSSRFMPIGFNINNMKLEFTGTFDGRGFEISNLYFESFRNYSFEESDLLYVFSTYFSMFNYNRGTIKNMGLVNPIITLENEHPSLREFSFLVGENFNIVQNVYLEDNRLLGQSGMQVLAIRTEVDTQKRAAGLVHTNRAGATLNNSYVNAQSIIHRDYLGAILEKPIYFTNEGTVTNSVYDSNRYGSDLTDFSGLPNDQQGISSNALRNPNNNLGNNWYYYPEASYPKLFGLKLENGNYEISDAVDFIYFNKLSASNILGLGNKTYSEQSFVLTSDINLKDVSKGAYNVLNKEFSGSFDGTNENYQINNLTLNKGFNDGINYYLGLFSVLTGTVKNLRIFNFEIIPTFTEDYTSQLFKVGSITGELRNGTIIDVSISTNIDFTNAQFKFGSFTVGSLVGEASGTVENIYNHNLSKIDLSGQSFSSDQKLNNELYLGGIIGKTSNRKLKLYNILNKGSIQTLNSINNIVFKESRSASLYTGGIIGYVNNQASYRHSLGLLTNEGTIKNTSFGSTNNYTHYIGGVLGYSTGLMYEFNSNYGLFTNYGEFINNNTINKTQYIAGVLNSNHSEAVEFTQLYNNKSLTINETNTNASLLINDVSENTHKLTVSQSKSYSNTLFVNIIKDIAVAINTTNPNKAVELRFVNINSNLKVYIDQTTTSEISYAGVTLNENTSFLNVSYGGNITFENQSGTLRNQTIWVSGITKILSSGNKMVNTINEGNIDLIVNTSRNVYVAGLVNRNLSGDLQSQDNAARPKATLGVINSINMADITVQLNSTGNTFVGGLVTLNGGNSSLGGSIQDAVNNGDILVKNSSNNSSANFSEGNNSGIVTSYSGGVILGGIVSSMTNGYSRIYDTSNNGNITGIARRFVRSGGVLGSALLYELVLFSNLNTIISGLDSNHFYQSETGDGYISNARVSNGINYGNIQAITEVIGEYSGSNSTMSGQRIAIHASAGGVIGYGLTRMTRMINHGNIISTDVAGGIVGATVAYHSSSTITVHINTAINYGSIRAARSGRQYNNIYLNNGTNNNTHLYPVNDSFISPLNANSSESNRETIRKAPANKRGFGGVFGRLQRGYAKTMTSNGTGNSFDFVVNMDPNVDLVGRLDQVSSYTTSFNYFIFADAIFYSAKENDNTQTLFTGEFRSNITEQVQIENGNGIDTHSYSQQGNNWYVTTTRTFNDATRMEKVFRGTFYQGQTRSRGSLDYIYPEVLSEYSYTMTRQSIANNAPRPASTPFSGVNYNSTSTTYKSGSSSNRLTRPVPQITENELQANALTKFVYDDKFQMRLDSTIVDDGTTGGAPITSYIYYAENSLLADRFKDARPNGMYVLSTTAGSTFGSVLPRNFVVTKFRKLKRDIPNNIDYDNINNDYFTENQEDLDIYNNLVNVYQSELYQTRLNDRSALLEDNQLVVGKGKGVNEIDFFLQEQTFTGNVVNFTVNQRMINSTDRTVDIELLKAELPSNALIAREKRINETPEDFQALLKAFVNANPGVKVATGDLAPNLTGTLQTDNNTRTVGSFVSYSEAAIHDATFTGSPNYYTSYTVTVNTVTNQSTPTLNNNLPFNEGRLTLNFNDNNYGLPNGYTIDQYLKISYVNELGERIEVDRQYYDIDSTPKSGQTFSSVVTFSNKLRNGNYILEYKFWESDEEKERSLTHTQTRNHSVLDQIVESGNNYDGTTSNIAFGYDLEEGTFTNGNGFTELVDSSIEEYLNRNTYSIDFLTSFITSDTFFDIKDVRVELIDSPDPSDEYYKYFKITYTLKDDSEIIRFIKEDKLLPTYYKNGVSLTPQADGSLHTYANREDDLTTLSLEYPISNLTDEFNILINGTPITEVDGFSYTVTNRLNIFMDKTVPPGIYDIEIYYSRDGNLIPAGIIKIEKLVGMNAYLENIEFSEYVLGIEYPNIYVVNNINTVIDNSYNPSVYFGGIDYVGSDNNGKRHFRIDGEVAGTPLNFYMPPNLVDYLPVGSKIQRKYYYQDEGSEEWKSAWTQRVNKDNTPAEIRASLEADFTNDPRGLTQPDEAYYIEYRVIPEIALGLAEGPDDVTYFISVRDINYSFLADFNFYYYDDKTDPSNHKIIPINEVAKFNDLLLHLNINNYLVKNGGNELNAEENINDDLTAMANKKFDEIIKSRSRLNMFYLINEQTKNTYTYGLANNFSGYYHFQMDIPKQYSYSMFLGEINENTELVKMSNNISSLDGYYYYINESPRTRTRYFNIVIYDIETIDINWGLTDKNNTWD